VTLVGPHGRRIPLSVTLREEARLEIAAFHWHCDYRPSGLTATLDLADLDLEPGVWRFEVSVSAAGLDRVGPLARVSTAGSAGRAASRIRADRVWTLDHDRAGLALTVAPVQVRLLEATERDRSLTVTVGADSCEELRLVDHRDKVLAAAKVRPAGDGRWQAVLPVGAQVFPSPITPGRLVAMRDGATTPVVPSGLPRYPGRPLDATGRRGTHVFEDGSGTTGVVPRVLCADEVTFADDEVLVTLDGEVPDGGALLLTSDLHMITGVRDAGTPRVRFPLRRTFWGHEGLAVPQGTYSLSWQPPGSQERHPIRPSATLWDRLPDTRLVTVAEVAAEVAVLPRTRLVIQVRPPLRADERGSRNQRVLREWALETRTDADAVFFRSLYGEVTNCNALGVHTELERRGAPLTKYWSIADLSVPVPPGGVGIVEGSREWHTAIASARYHMVNVHQLFNFTKSPGQVVIQTMHGYPYKLMGHDLWASRRFFFKANQVESYDQRAREWDYFVSPATYATPLLRAAFLTPAHSEAEVLEIGYPRNDILQSGDAEKVRLATRELLGISPGQKAVLYAPTYRDYLSSDDLTADRVDFLNGERAARLLGPDYVLLMRGHAFVARTGQRVAGDPRVIDVSDHPDVNELILASDVGVLDYSSLRFDYALTDKPMIFLVPDLQQYDAARPGIIDYAPTAPGPMVSTTREVVELLRDVDGLAARYAAARERFRQEYADLDDGHASARLVDAVMVPRGDAPAR
jgi:CDP-glycerol glycerophosphotransferase